MRKYNSRLVVPIKMTEYKLKEVEQEMTHLNQEKEMILNAITKREKEALDLLKLWETGGELDSSYLLAGEKNEISAKKTKRLQEIESSLQERFAVYLEWKKKKEHLEQVDEEREKHFTKNEMKKAHKKAEEEYLYKRKREGDV